MKVLYIGSVEFSAKALLHILEMPVEVVGVCTLERSTFNSDHVNLGPLAEKANVPYRYTKDINSTDVINWVKSLEAMSYFVLVVEDPKPRIIRGY